MLPLCNIQEGPRKRRKIKARRPKGPGLWTWIGPRGPDGLHLPVSYDCVLVVERSVDPAPRSPGRKMCGWRRILDAKPAEKKVESSAKSK